MNCKIKMTSKGQITIPKEIRDQLGLGFGTYLEAQVKGYSIVLKPSNQDSMVIREYTEKYGKEGLGLEKLRQLTREFPVSMANYLRKTRDEEGDGR